jgi:multimeric flavodoxin WrbA
MSKKVLIISSSPRRNGNSDTLCNQFQKGAIESGHNVEKVFLRDKKINYCMGCEVCNTTHKCVQNDDMALLLDKMVNADVIVLATPVYFYTMDGQLKTFIDRTVPRYTEISNKEFYYIMTCADTENSALDKTIESLRGFTQDCLENPIEKGIVYGVGAWHVGEIQNTSAYNEAYTMGKNV